jgi:hypothetical protein
MLGGKGGGVASMPESKSPASQPEPVAAGSSAPNDFDDDIPF